MHEQKRSAAPPRQAINSQAVTAFIESFDNWFSNYDHIAPPDDFDPKELTMLQRAWLDMLAAAGHMALAFKDYETPKPVEYETAL